MCGIAGLVDLSGQLPVQEVIDCALKAMQFRGPDGSGIHRGLNYAIGMRRLSIIDRDGGSQPQSDESGQIRVVQNGEIYNFKSLRQNLISRGHSFKSFSDTEVIVHGYKEWGIDGLLSRIDGMFVFAIVDERKGVLHLARDRFGEKPLYYHFGCKTFGFASNMKALIKALNLSKEIDPLSLKRYLALHYVPGARTIFKNIERLLPGERIQVSLCNTHSKKLKYYNFLEIAEGENHGEDLESLLNTAVKTRLVGDVQIGVFLSGGLDSSLITNLTAHHMPDIKTFSIGFNSIAHDESQHAQSVAKALGVDHHLVNFTEEDFTRTIPLVASALDEPIGDQATLPTYKLCEEASQYVKVVLSGEGADELFGGYNYYNQFERRFSPFAKLNSSRSASQLNEFIDDSLSCTPSGFPLVINREVRSFLMKNPLNESKDKWEEDIISSLNTVRNPLNRACATDAMSWLPDNLLVKLDRMTMSKSIEARCPFLEKNLAEYALKMSSSKKIKGKKSKVALRSLGRKYLPRCAWKRNKQGFVLPMSPWIKKYLDKNGGPVHFVKDRNCSWLDEGAMIRQVKNWTSGIAGAERALYALIIFLEWNSSFENH